MNAARFDFVSAGYVFAYDAKSGEVLRTHEKSVEVIDGCEERPPRITEAECEQVRAEVARDFPGREVDALITPEGFALRENVLLSVDPGNKVVREVPGDPPGRADCSV